MMVIVLMVLNYKRFLLTTFVIARTWLKGESRLSILSVQPHR